VAAVLNGSQSKSACRLSIQSGELPQGSHGKTKRVLVWMFRVNAGWIRLGTFVAVSRTNVGSHPFFPSEEDMKNFVSKVQRFLKSEDGPTAVEYAIMLALIVVVCLTAIGSIGTNANTQFNAIATSLN
jgi:pilus assembly protein Flp/PilA